MHSRKVLRFEAPESKSQYYIDKCNELVRLGYENPSADKGDPRQTEIWNYIKDNNLSVSIVEDYDYASKLYDPEQIGSDKCITACQARSIRHDKKLVKELCTRFYEQNEKQKRPSIGFEIDETLYPSSGNHRGLSHAEGQRKYPKSEVNAPLILVGEHNIETKEKLSKSEKQKYMSRIAAMSNKKTNDTTKPETDDDIVTQTKTAWNIELKDNPKMNTWNMDKKKQWFNEWYKTCKGHGGSRYMTSIFNRAFHERYGNAIPMPEDETLQKKIWESKFIQEKDVWSPQENESLSQGSRIQICWKTSLQVLDSHLLNKLSDLKEENKNSEKIPFDIMMSVGGAKLVKLDNINDQRENTLKHFSKLNKGLFAALEVCIEKVLFIKQVEIDENEVVAYEWSYLAQQYNPTV